MAVWMVAPSYQNAKVLKIDENAKKAYISQKCDRCGGRGYYAVGMHNDRPVLSPWDGGVCYSCGGKGTIDKWVKAYTEDEYTKYIAAQERTRERKKQVEEERRQALLDNSEKNRKDKLVEWGYDPENPVIYLATGVRSTYDIKDYLKEQGCKFNNILGWYNSHSFEMPENYLLVSVPFDDIYEWFPYAKRFDIKEDAKEKADAALSAALPKSNSEYIGDIKERIRDLEVEFTGSRDIEGFYGTSHIYTFLSGENVIVWITSSCQSFEKGEIVLLTGTVKEHSEYKGIKQTKMSRCIIKKER